MELGFGPLKMSCQYTLKCVSFSFLWRPRSLRSMVLAKCSPSSPAEETAMRRKICTARNKMSLVMLCFFFIMDGLY